MRCKHWLLAGVALWSSVAVAVATDPPKPAAATGGPAAIAAPVKPAGPWDTQADAGQQIADALKRARRNNTRVLLEWGGNTYPKSLAFHAQLTSDEKLRKTILYEYEHVLIDYGQPMGKNVPLSKQFDADVNGDGVPYLTVLDTEGRMFANQPIGVFDASTGGKISYDATAVVKFLEANKAAPVAASSVLEKGLAAAKASNKRVFLRFGAPWCGWCRRIDDWLARPDVAPVLAKDFVDVKIDVDRNPGGQAMLARYSRADNVGIPWCAILDADGKAIADSFIRPGEGNIGFPTAPEEIARFGTMLAAGARSISDEELKQLLATLKGQPATEEGGR